jgi:hypothetical protein
MKKIILTAIALTALILSASAQNENTFSTKVGQDTTPMGIVKPESETFVAPPAKDTAKVSKGKAMTNAKGEIIKKGLSFGVLPFVAVDAEKGFNYGLILNMYNFGDGSSYPKPKATTKLDFSMYTKGRKLIQLSYDDLYLIPGVRTSLAATLTIDNMLNFYGFNGYQSILDLTYITKKNSAYNPSFYYMYRMVPSLKADFTGHITEHFYWEAGYHFTYTKAHNYDETSTDQTSSLFSLYKAWGIIPSNVANGGISSEIRAGVLFDTRDSENYPTKGIWAEAFGTLAPKFIGNTDGYGKLDAIWRQYIPLYKDRLVFAYRVSYAQFVGSSIPWYSLPYLYVVGPNIDRDAIGGYRTVRGMMSSRVLGKGMGFYNAEFRWNFVNFKLFKQNWGLAFSAFNDGTKVFVPLDMTNKTGFAQDLYAKYINATSPDAFHFTVGGGLRVILNRNFIVCAELGHSFNTQDNVKFLTFDLNTDWLF